MLICSKKREPRSQRLYVDGDELSKLEAREGVLHAIPSLRERMEITPLLMQQLYGAYYEL